ncbi:MAG: hypothetical protein KDB01_21980 [Planctomycetaceae bacterium]|nr:hypothetical protein [Planctomycetaceae bacterium]
MSAGSRSICNGAISFARWTTVFAVVYFASRVTAQQITVEQTFAAEEDLTTCVVEEASTADKNAVPRIDFTSRTATFTTTRPEQLFDDNIVYADPIQKPVTEEWHEILPPDLTIPSQDHPLPVDPLPVDPLPVDPLVVVPPPGPLSGSTAAGCAEETIHHFNDPEIDEKRLKYSRLMHEPYTVYRSEQSVLAWLPAHGEDFGWLDWQTDPYLRRGDNHGLTGAINIHWLAGPISSPLPPRLYDFTLGYQSRKKLSDQFSYDVSTSLGAYSDFEASARKGIRFPSHAVGMVHVNRSTDFIFGADYLDRDDIRVLPVVGLSLRDVFLHGLRMDLVFPRPRIDYMLSETNRIYLAGQMNGGTWQVRFPDRSNPAMTYRDLRLLLGFESTSKGGGLSAWEFGYVFDRRLEFRDQPGLSGFEDAFVIQWVSRH